MARRSEHSVAIDAPPDVVFSALNDIGRLKEWQSGVIDATATPEGPLAAGSRVAKVRKTPAGKTSFEDEIVTLDTTRRVRTDRVHGGMISGTTSEWRVRQNGSGSVLNLTIDWQIAGLARIIAPSIVRSAAGQMASELARFARMIARDNQLE